MTEAFSINEIIELGIQIEFNGRDFYQTLAESEKDEKIRELFLFLKDEEVKHIRFFEKLLEASEDYRSDSYPEEYFAYMNALAGEHVFTQKDKGKEIAGKIKTAIEAIDMAISLEKDAIIFYDGMKKIVPQDKLEMLDMLIREEHNHFLQLSELKSSLQS